MQKKWFVYTCINRYERLCERETVNNGQHSDNSVSIKSQVYIHSSMKDKMVHLFDELRVMRSEQIMCA